MLNRFVHEFLCRGIANGQGSDAGEHRLETGNLRGFLHQLGMFGHILQDQQHAGPPMVGDHVISTFVDECLTVMIKEAIGLASPHSQRFCVPGHCIGKEPRP